MNPIFGNAMSGFQRMQQVMRDVQMLRQNPSQLGQYLADHGMIGQEQIADVSKMGFQQAGQYLMQNGVMPQQQVQQMSQMVPMIQNQMK